MRRSSLGLVLIAVNVSLALLALAGLAGAAAALLRRFSTEQALARVRQASVSAEHAITAQGDALATTTRLLAEHETAIDLLARRRYDELSRDLEAFRRAGGLAAVAILRDGVVVSKAGPALDWTAVTGIPASAANDLHVPPSGGVELRCAIPLPTRHAFAAAAQILDASFAKRLGEDLGVRVRIVDRENGIGDLGDPKLPLRARLLHDAPPDVKRLDEIGVFATVRALRDADGRVAGFLEVEIPTARARESHLRLVRRLSILAVVIGGIAALASVVVARRVAAPLERLTEATERIGGGDLATPVETRGPAEIGRLAASMEDMRRRLSRLTAELQEQRAEARAMVNGIVEGVYVVDGARRVVQMNPQAAAMLGVEPSQVIGRFCGDVLNPEPVGNTRPCEENCPILHARFRGEARATERLVLADGRRRTVVVTSSMSGGDRQFQLVRDETEVETARRLRDAVLANISHEFKTPLAAQLASLELLLNRLPELGPDETRSLIESLQRGALRLTQLIDNLLESVRIEAGRATLRRHAVHLDQILEDAIEMVRPLAEQKGQTIDVALPHPLPPVTGDGPRLVQVFVNLLANAGKFAPDRTAIRVGGETAAGRIAVFVEDEGPGWSEEVEPQLFEPFVRGSGEEPESVGVGLGLYIAKSIVERHGGTIDARSGSGRTRVTVKLPVEGGA